MTRGIVYYTHRGAGDIYEACRRQIDRARGDVPVVTVSLAPLDWHRNIVLDLQPGILTMFRQQLAGLQAIETEVVFFCEHDVLYHPCHFDFEPPDPHTYYFNSNVWAVDTQDGKALYYDGMKMTSGLVAFRDILIEHYTKKVAWVEAEGGTFSRRRMGFEPGKKVSKGRLGDYEWAYYRAAFPNVDLKHCGNITRKRFALQEYRSRRQLAASWQLTDRVPYWGVTQGRFAAFLQEAVP
jgi:hypothetical protein